MLRDLLIGVVLTLLLFFELVSPAQAQHLLVKAKHEEQKTLNRYDYAVDQTDSLSILSAVNRLISDLQKDGYFQASASRPHQLDSLRWETFVTIGPRYDWVVLAPGNLDPLVQEKTGFREQLFLGRPFSYEQVRQLMEEVLAVAENEGFPFASVQLSQVRIEQEEVRAEVHYQPGPYITFGPLHITGTDQVKADYLATQLRIRQGSAYSERHVRNISRHIRNIPFVELTEAVSVSFQNNEAEIHLALSERKSSQVDALLNFLPNENERGTLLLTGHAEVQLNNLFKSGKQLYLQWRRLQLASQQLSLSYQHPYLFKSPLQAGLSFHFLKEDTLFLNRRLAFQIDYPSASGPVLGLETTLLTSNGIGAADIGATAGQSVGDFNVINTGLTVEAHGLNDILFPSQGVHLTAYLGVGRKTVRNAQPELIQNTFWQPQAQLTFRQYYQIGQLWMLYHRLDGAFLYSQNLYLNELYRLGGINSLRGFNDNLFFASYYGLSNLEIRLLMEKSKQSQSYLFVFYDQAILGYNLQERVYQDSPLGLGAGISLTTQAGVFNLVYALGRTKSTRIDPALSKIHFGYVSRF